MIGVTLPTPLHNPIRQNRRGAWLNRLRVTAASEVEAAVWLRQKKRKAPVVIDSV